MSSPVSIPVINHSSITCHSRDGWPCSICEWLKKQKEAKS